MSTSASPQATPVKKIPIHLQVSRQISHIYEPHITGSNTLDVNFHSIFFITQSSQGRLYIKRGQIVNHDSTFAADIYIEDGNYRHSITYTESRLITSIVFL